MTKDGGSKSNTSPTEARCGTNSSGNRYKTPGGTNKSSSSSYHYSNKDGSYYYKNDNGSTYYNPGRGTGGYYMKASGESKWYVPKK